MISIIVLCSTISSQPDFSTIVKEYTNKGYSISGEKIYKKEKDVICQTLYKEDKK